MGVAFSFNAYTVVPSVIPEPVPSGEYDVAIKEIIEKATKAGNGDMLLEVHNLILSGEFKGRVVIDRLNHKNKNDQAREIAMAQLSAICHVTGVMQIQRDLAELYGKPYKLVVHKGPRSDDSSKNGNEVRGYLNTAGEDPLKIAEKLKSGGGGFGGGSGSGFSDDTKTETKTTKTEPEVDPRIVQKMVGGMTYEDAVAAVKAEDAAKKAAASSGPSPEEIARKAAQAAAAAAAAAAASGGGDAVGDGDETPEWAR